MWYTGFMMKNDNDNYSVQSLSVTIEKASRSLHSSLRYIYAVSAGDFYNINVKDLFKISLSDIGRTDILSNLGILPSDELKGEGFERLCDLMYYAFAVRTPYLRRHMSQSRRSDRFFRELFEACVEKGANDSDNIVQEDFKRVMKLAKSAVPEPPFNGEWFRRWVYSRGGDLAAISNRNMFLLGCMDALLPLFYAKLTDVLIAESIIS
jgi:hypothetical protein